MSDISRETVDRLEATRGVKVKPLEWKPASQQLNHLCANSVMGEYEIFIERKAAMACSLDGVRFEEISVPEPRTPEAAKAAAQADYERRILSALEPDHSEWDAGYDAGIELAAREARRYAGHYRQGTDGRNTFIILAENLERALKRCTHPNLEASTCGFESCPDCGARLEDD